MPIARSAEMDRKNSFTFLRLVFALVVVFSHSFAIGGFGPDPLLRITGGQVQSGFAAVLCFFIVSGFLITASAQRHPLRQFMLNRAVRILPGFWAVQLLTALVLAPALILAKHPSVENYFESLVAGEHSALSYLFSNATLHISQYNIFDIFEGLPAGPAVNGSLWSLGPEVVCYLYLGGLAYFGGLRRRLVTVALAVAVYGVHLLAYFDPNNIDLVAQICSVGGVHFLQQSLFRSLYVAFVAGMVFFQYRHLLRWNPWWAAAALLTLAGASYFRCFDIVWPVTLPYVILFLAHRLPLHGVERLGDFSFGIYIYSFPIQQCLALWGFQQFGVTAFVLTSLALALAAGVLSWRWIEEPVLRWARSARSQELKAAIPLGHAAVPQARTALPDRTPSQVELKV